MTRLSRTSRAFSRRLLSVREAIRICHEQKKRCLSFEELAPTLESHYLLSGPPPHAANNNEMTDFEAHHRQKTICFTTLSVRPEDRFPPSTFSFCSLSPNVSSVPWPAVLSPKPASNSSPSSTRLQRKVHHRPKRRVQHLALALLFRCERGVVHVHVRCLRHKSTVYPLQFLVSLFLHDNLKRFLLLRPFQIDAPWKRPKGFACHPGANRRIWDEALFLTQGLPSR